jgi:hypothetical protein
MYEARKKLFLSNIQNHGRRGPGISAIANALKMPNQKNGYEGSMDFSGVYSAFS